MKHLYIIILACFASCLLSLYPLSSRAQIGYQVSLLNTATGEPRAGVTVNAAVTITDAADKVVYSGSQQVTSNDFGVLSLVVGNADTFANADYSKLPFFVSVSVDGTLIGKSQILSVPVAEYAKRTGELTKEKLVGTWVREVVYEEMESTGRGEMTFSDKGTFQFSGLYYLKGNLIDGSTSTGEYFIIGNTIYLVSDDIDKYEEGSAINSDVSIECKTLIYVPSHDMIYSSFNIPGSYVKQ